MLAEVLLDTLMQVHYGFLTLCSAQVQDDDSDDAWRAQANGLVGAAVPELLRIRTETHTGQVHVKMELHSAEPELTDDWPEAVEVCFTSWVDDLTLSAFEDFDGPIDLPPGGYRVRYAGRLVDRPAKVAPPDGLDSCDELDEMRPVEDCLLQFWPATGADRIIRQTGQSAAVWHRTGTRPPWTAAELSARVEELRESRERHEQEPAEAVEQDQGLATLTGQRYFWLLQSLGPHGRQIGELDASLAAHLTHADPVTLRAIACWAIDQALTITQIRDLSGIDEALAAVRRGTGLPPAFNERDRIYARLPALQLESEEPEDIQRARQAFAKHQALEQLYLTAGSIDMETTCSILLTTGRLSGDSPDWIVVAVRHVFPQLVPAGR